MDSIPQRISISIRPFISILRKSITIDKVILYGSYSNGRFSKDSDVDIAIFSSDFNDKSSIDATSFLFGIARSIKDVCIEPIGFGSDVLSQDNPFVQEIMKTGTEVK